jgi:hypothetical protein
LTALSVNTKKTPWHMGAELTFDPKSEQFTGGDRMEQANALVRREDRVPHVVPETV